jgi:hypothetical protein
MGHNSSAVFKYQLRYPQHIELKHADFERSGIAALAHPPAVMQNDQSED